VTIQHPLRIFHITAICNLASIAKSKALYANSQLRKKQIQYGNIAYQGAQGTRAAKLVAKPPAGVIHDYVPFYFAPRSPMLFTINKGNVPDCPYRQRDIVHFMTTVEIVIENELPYVFYDYNATLSIANCYGSLKDLDKIDWNLFYEPPRMDGYCKYWHSVLDNPRYIRRQETRQAEFLIHKSVPLKHMSMVGTYNEEKAAEVKQIFDDARVKLHVEAKPEWYF
jgi:hypothetical protein